MSLLFCSTKKVSHLFLRDAFMITATKIQEPYLIGRRERGCNFEVVFRNDLSHLHTSEKLLTLVRRHDHRPLMQNKELTKKNRADGQK